jgi:hypothetical protein
MIDGSLILLSANIFCIDGRWEIDFSVGTRKEYVRLYLWSCHGVPPVVHIMWVVLADLPGARLGNGLFILFKVYPHLV